MLLRRRPRLPGPRPRGPIARCRAPTPPPAAAASRARLAWTLTAGARLRAAYAERVLRGTFVIELPTPVTVRALALAGFDFAVLDLEHSTIGVDGLPGLIAEARAVDLPVLVRVWAGEPALIGKVLDAGANAIMVPHVATPEAAERAVRAARRAPRGERGVAPLVSAVATADRDAADAAVLVVVQLEGEEAIRRSAEIARVPGVDGAFVGPYDLAEALGRPGEVDGPEVRRAAERVAAEHEGPSMLGIYVDDPRRSADWAHRGFRLQCVSFDSRLLLAGATAALARAREEPAAG